MRIEIISLGRVLVLGSLLFFEMASAGVTTKFICKSGTTGGTVVTVSGCIGPDGRFAPCYTDGDQSEWLTIARETPLVKQTPDMVEIVKIPGRLAEINVNFEEEYSLSVKLNMPTRNMNFEVVGCEFAEQ